MPLRIICQSNTPCISLLTENVPSFNVALLPPPGVDCPLLPWTFGGYWPPSASPFMLGGQLSVLQFERLDKKKWMLGGLKEFIPHILAWRRGGRGLYLVSCAYIYYRMSLTKHWNNLFCLAHDNNNKEFYWVYFSYCKHVSVFFEDLEFNTIFFHWIQWICFCCQSDSKWSQVQFYTWFQYCTSTCSRFAIAKATTPLKYVSAKCIYIKRKKRLNLLTDLFSL